MKQRPRMPMIDAGHYEHGGAVGMTIKAGNRGKRRVVPPAGESYAFDVTQWARRVEIHVSPTGRSVRVWVDGVLIPKEDQ